MNNFPAKLRNGTFRRGLISALRYRLTDVVDEGNEVDFGNQLQKALRCGEALEHSSAGAEEEEDSLLQEFSLLDAETGPTFFFESCVVAMFDQYATPGDDRRIEREGVARWLSVVLGKAVGVHHNLVTQVITKEGQGHGITKSINFERFR